MNQNTQNSEQLTAGLMPPRTQFSLEAENFGSSEDQNSLNKISPNPFRAKQPNKSEPDEFGLTTLAAYQKAFTENKKKLARNYALTRLLRAQLKEQRASNHSSFRTTAGRLRTVLERRNFLVKEKMVLINLISFLNQEDRKNRDTRGGQKVVRSPSKARMTKDQGKITELSDLLKAVRAEEARRIKKNHQRAGRWGWLVRFMRGLWDYNDFNNVGI